MIISDVNGEFLTGYFYNNGGRQTIHIASETKLTNNEQYTIIRFHKKTAATKGGDGYSSGEANDQILKKDL